MTTTTPIIFIIGLMTYGLSNYDSLEYFPREPWLIEMDLHENDKVSTACVGLYKCPMCH